MTHTFLKYRRPLIVAVHLFLVAFSNYIAFCLRFDGSIPDVQLALWRQMLPTLVIIRGLMFVPFRLYTGLWRYAGVWDLRNIIGGVLASTVVFAILAYGVFGMEGYSKSILVIDSALLICCMGGSRLARRFVREFGGRQGGKRVLIYGAGDAGEMIVRDMRNNDAYPYEPVGFIDDDTIKVGQRIHGLRVLGTRQNLSSVIAAVRPEEILVAIPSAAPSTIRDALKSLERFKIPIKTLPNMRDIIGGKVTVSQIRTLAVEDLLSRAPVGLKASSVRQLISGKRVMVTGAGGSIGSELCRQIAALKPEALLLFERYENSLYAIGNDLANGHASLKVVSIIGDVTDTRRVYEVLETYLPDIIFHAAAHKHVPLMEANPCEAVKNNVLGTRTMAEAAAKFSVGHFILISTDKAVNPCNVMGATKRMAELVIQDLARRSATRFSAVRFGNVLGSNGSVVPRFLEQIEAGGPVTVTHPKVKRYFMLIPEAVTLVLHAAALGQRGAIYVLDMGEQINILDMARNLIRLSGFIPEEEIPITFVGLRPGEKLYEELIGEDETAVASEVDKIFRIESSRHPDSATLEAQLTTLEQLAFQEQSKAVVEFLHDIILTLRPQSAIVYDDEVKVRSGVM